MTNPYRVEECTQNDFEELTRKGILKWTPPPSMIVVKVQKGDELIFLAYFNHSHEGPTEVGILPVHPLQEHWRSLFHARNFLNTLVEREGYDSIHCFVPDKPERFRRTAEFFGLRFEGRSPSHFGVIDGLLMCRDLRRKRRLRRLLNG